MQTFSYAGVTIYYTRLLHDDVPISLARQCDGNLVLVCRPPEGAEEDLLSLREVELCWDCHTLQRHDEPDKACLLCGGDLVWAEVGDERVGV